MGGACSWRGGREIRTPASWTARPTLPSLLEGLTRVTRGRSVLGALHPLVTLVGAGVRSVRTSGRGLHVARGRAAFTGRRLCGAPVGTTAWVRSWCLRLGLRAPEAASTRSCPCRAGTGVWAGGGESRTSRRDELPAHWCFPGGGPQAGNNPLSKLPDGSPLLPGSDQLCASTTKGSGFPSRDSAAGGMDFPLEGSLVLVLGTGAPDSPGSSRSEAP